MLAVLLQALRQAEGLNVDLVLNWVVDRMILRETS